MKTAIEVLREMEVSSNIALLKNNEDDYYIVDTTEDHVANAMMIYAAQFIDLAAEEAKAYDTHYTGIAVSGPEVDKQSILNIKKQIK